MLVATENLSKRFGKLLALNRCNLQIAPGTVFGLLGPNGAGKTTLLRLLMGFMYPSEGSAKIDGFDCHKESVQSRRSLTYLPGDAQLFGSMKGRKVLKFFSQVRSDCELNKALIVADRLELDLNRRVAFMSTGMRQKLALCVCLSTMAKLTILDEPTANLDPNVRSEVIRIISEIKSQGRTVIFSSHVLSEIEDVCDRVVIMKKGQIVRDLDMEQLKSRHRVQGRFSESGCVIPEELTDRVHWRDTGKSNTLEVVGSLSEVMRWIVSMEVSELRISPVGLRHVYDECHDLLLPDENPLQPEQD